jgi:hypothetical protein
MGKLDGKIALVTGGNSADEYLKVHDRGRSQADVWEGSGGICQHNVGTGGIICPYLSVVGRTAIAHLCRLLTK